MLAPTLRHRGRTALGSQRFERFDATEGCPHFPPPLWQRCPMNTVRLAPRPNLGPISSERDELHPTSNWSSHWQLLLGFGSPANHTVETQQLDRPTFR